MKKMMKILMLSGSLAPGLSNIAVAQTPIQDLEKDLGELSRRIGVIEGIPARITKLEEDIAKIPDPIKGDRGIQGVQGPPGLRGFKGDNGPTGSPGDKGEPGRNGRDGKDGARGPIGSQGLSGLTGPAGSRGPEGPQGVQGLAGLPGQPGQIGPAGKNGKDGVSIQAFNVVKEKVAAVEKNFTALKKEGEEAVAAAVKKVNKSIKSIEKEKRDMAAIYNALSGVQYVFGEDNRFSMSGSVGFHNTSNAAFAVGVAVKPRDNIMAQGSIASSEAMENFGGNVSISVGFW